MRESKKYNYVYNIKYITGKYYIGVRSCNCEIYEDMYFGSAFHIPKDIKLTGMRCILSMHNTREEAELEEIRLHTELNVKDNPDYYNECNANSTKFYPSKEALKRASIKRTGRTAETHDYIKKQAEKRKLYREDTLTTKQKEAYSNPIRNAKLSESAKKYKGANRTPAQKARDAKMLGVKQGPNPSKGNPGFNHRSIGPWWYITPENKYVEVFTSVNDYCKHTNPFPVSSKSVSRYLSGNSTPNARNSKCKEWKFGHLINLNTALD